MFSPANAPRDVPAFKPADVRDPAVRAGFVDMDRRSRQAQGTGRFFTDTIGRDAYPGDPQMWDHLKAMDDRLKALRTSAAPAVEAPRFPPRGRIPQTPVDYLRPLSELDRSEAVAQAQAWCDGGTGGLLLVGSVGTGKTSIAAAVCVEFGAPEAFWPIRDLLAAVKAADFDTGDALAGRRLRDTLFSRSLLVVDDCGAERGTDYEGDALRSILEARCSRPVSTVVTTNLTRSERSVYLGDRLASRLAEWSQVAVLGEDRRRGGL